jgi:ligand-binding SRPBCC domain-containing protein
MADHVLETRFWVSRPRADVFAFFADPRNLERVTPRLRWRSPPPPLAAGAVLDFRLSFLGLPTSWRVIVREWDPPHRFVDALVRGPFARWEHRHRFLEGPEDETRGGPSGTWVEDRVTYRLSGGPLGAVLDSLGASARVNAAFVRRQQRAKALLRT